MLIKMHHFSEMRARAVRAFFVFLFVAGAAPITGQAADRLAGKLKNDAMVYSQPDGSSPVVGKLRQGTVMWLNGEAQGDFYPIKLPKPVNNLTVGWLRSADIQTYTPGQGAKAATKDPKGRPAARRGGPGAPASNILMVSGGMNMTSPFEWQLAMGEAQASASLLRIGGEYRRRMGTHFSMGVSGFYDKLSGEAPTVSGTYSLSGMGGGLPLAYSFTEGSQFTVNAVITPGLGLFTAANSNATNSNATQEISTTNIMAVVVAARLEVGYWFSPSFGVMGNLAYLTSSLPDVATLADDGSQVTANINLSSVGFSLGLALGF